MESTSTDDVSVHIAHADAHALDKQGAKKARPFMKWAGGKSQIMPELLRRLPPSFQKYIEPFIGGGALFFGCNPASALLCDLNEELMNTYRVVRDQVDELVAALSTHVYEKSYYYKIRGLDRSSEFSSVSPVERAARMIFLNKTCFNGLYRVNSKGQFNVPFGRYTHPKILDEANLRLCSRALKNAELHSCGYGDCLVEISEGDFVYLDPPYHPLNETSSFTAYHQEGFGTDHQKALSEFCRKIHSRGAKFMLSNSDTTLIHELYADFNVETVSASRAINSKANGRGPLNELIIRNYL